MAWRGAIHEWTLPDGTVTTLLNLGPHQETVRKFLVGETSFPHEVASVIVLVCSDPESRSVWGLPSQVEEAGCENYRFMARGVLFRVLLGETIPQVFRDSSCVAARQYIAYGNCAHRVNQDFAALLAARVEY
jgi:hypothetical protein